LEFGAQSTTRSHTSRTERGVKRDPGGGGGGGGGVAHRGGGELVT
jgi:hypothetical protein